MALTREEMKEQLEKLKKERYDYIKSKPLDSTVNADERDIRSYTVMTLSEQIRGLQDDLQFEVSKSMENYASKLDRLTTALNIFTVILLVIAGASYFLQALSAEGERGQTLLNSTALSIVVLAFFVIGVLYFAIGRKPKKPSPASKLPSTAPEVTTRSETPKGNT